MPQAQAPAAEHPSAISELHAAHAAPRAPQVASASGRQSAPEQQPAGQVEALQPLQTPPRHACPAGQGRQAPPPEPHESVASPERQAPVGVQQPSGQELPSQKQPLPVQRWPGGHDGPVPQRQPPWTEQLSAASRSQRTQLDPASPQLVSPRSSQRLPTQQPLGQDVPSQMHRPPLQRCPPPQAGPSPHRQAPSGLQVSALLVSQVRQAAPGAPHADRLRPRHTLPAQHPSGHDASSQTQTPPSHRWPSPHGAVPPHRHSPVTAQVSARSASQARQAPALTPHVGTDRG